MSDGRSVEIGFVGAEGIVGIASLLGMRPSAYEAVMQVDGRGLRVPIVSLQKALDESDGVKTLFLRYMSFRENLLAQTAACNRLHTLKQRCDRWLLTVHDNVEGDTFHLTHEFLALMMGVNRPVLSLAVQALQQQGIIKYPRASLTIVDRQALERDACECYMYLSRALDWLYKEQ